MLNIAAVGTGFCEREKIGGENAKWMVLQGSREQELDHKMYGARCC